MKLYKDPPFHGAISNLEADELAYFASRSDPVLPALELGCWTGFSTAVLMQTLPPRKPFYTVDHHRGDKWAPAVSEEVFSGNVAPFVVNREWIHEPMDFRLFLSYYVGPKFDFVFYDADHTATANRDFWGGIRGHLAPSAVILFDDADFEGELVLASLLEEAGFLDLTRREIKRAPDGCRYRADKGYTTRVMGDPRYWKDHA